MLPRYLRSELRQADSAYSTVGKLGNPLSMEINEGLLEKNIYEMVGFPMLCLNTRGYHQFVEPLYMNFVWSYDMYDWGRDY